MSGYARQIRAALIGVGTSIWQWSCSKPAANQALANGPDFRLWRSASIKETGLAVMASPVELFSGL